MHLSNTTSISDEATFAVNITCKLLSANNNIDAITTNDTQDSFDELMQQITSSLRNYSCHWIQEVVGSTSFPMDCNGTPATVKEDLDELCDIWEYQLLIDTAKQSLATYSEGPLADTNLNQWVCDHGLQSDVLVQSTGLFDVDACM